MKTVIVPDWTPSILWAAVGLIVCAAVAVVSDVLRRFARSERKLRALLASMDDLILVHDRKGTYIEFLPSNEKLLVHPKEQLLGRTMHEVLPREIADAALEAIEAALTSGRPVEVDYDLSVDDHPTWFTGKVTPLENERVLCVVRDITARKVAEQELQRANAELAARKLRESDERFHLLARATNDVIWDWNIVENTVWWNEGMRAQFGYTEDVSSAPRFWRERVHPDDLQRVQGTIDEALGAGSSSWQAEYRIRRADDLYATVLDRGYIVRGDDTTPLRMVGAMMDVTEEKLMHERLEQATRVSSLGRIATAIAHEFNNVLMGIQPNLEVVRRRAGDDLAAPIGHILQSVKRGKRITDEILRFTRPAPLMLQCVEVTRFLEDWRGDITPALGYRIKLTIDAEEDLYISADPQQVAQVLTNLAVNARDAISGVEGELTVTVAHVRSYGTLGFASIPTADRFVHFAIRDNGNGMTAEQLTHVFEPLFTTKKGGTGLGLAVSYQIITNHDGYITAESNPGGGTTFHILIPQTLPILETARDAQPELPSSTRVLVVEDESAVSAGICALLELEGMQTRVVDTGAAAVPAVEKFAPDAVILDIGLPDMTGIDVYRLLDARWPRLPVLFSSGHAGVAKLETYLERDHVALLLKPYDVATLHGTLGSLLRVKQAGAA